MANLFDDDPVPRPAPRKQSASAPLAEKMRPQSWDDFQYEDSFDKTLLSFLQTGQGSPPSLVLWGPPGTGKTTFAKLVGQSFGLPFIEFSAVLGGVQEIRQIVAAAQKQSKPTLLFVDEIHRFNKSQQDAFLPHVESGTIILIGATTENPSFALNSALLSRMRVLVFKSLSASSLQTLLKRAEKTIGLTLSEEARDAFIQLAGGDGRRLLNWYESFSTTRSDRIKPVQADDVKSYLKQAQTQLYDRAGDQHFDTISAFIKCLRGSNPDAALLYGFRMIEAGEDPRYLLRRMMIFASEDIGNADPYALSLTVSTAEAYDRLGLPEGKIPIAQCITYLATAPKSNRSYLAMGQVLQDIRNHPNITIPMHLRNAPTPMMKEMGYNQGYQYPHDNPSGYVAGVQYLPDELAMAHYYKPSEHGHEKLIHERMQQRKKS